jgi:FkbM family methyltransferase
MELKLTHKGNPVQLSIALLKLHVPGWKFPVTVRPDTSDLGTLGHTYYDHDYDLVTAKPPRLILDCGANVGFVSIHFANQFPDARIVSIEPMPENFAMLCENTQPYPNIQPLNAAIWNKPGTIDLVTHDQDNKFLGHWGVQVKENAPASAGAVRAMTIAEILESTGLPFIDILKIDIEGAELEVFDKNAHEWLSKTNMLIIELHDRFKPGCSTAVFEALRPFGFMAFTRAENTFFVRNNPL